MGPPFATDTYTLHGVDVLVLSGELDLASSGQLRAAFDELAAVRVDELVIDARHLDFIDSRGLHALMDCTEDLRAKGAVAVVPSKQVRRVLELTALDQVIRIVDSMDATITAKQ